MEFLIKILGIGAIKAGHNSGVVANENNGTITFWLFIFIFLIFAVYILRRKFIERDFRFIRKAVTIVIGISATMSALIYFR